MTLPLYLSLLLSVPFSFTLFLCYSLLKLVSVFFLSFSLYASLSLSSPFIPKCMKFLNSYHRFLSLSFSFSLFPSLSRSNLNSVSPCHAFSVSLSFSLSPLTFCLSYSTMSSILPLYLSLSVIPQSWSHSKPTSARLFSLSDIVLQLIYLCLGLPVCLSLPLSLSLSLSVIILHSFSLFAFSYSFAFLQVSTPSIKHLYSLSPPSLYLVVCVGGRVRVFSCYFYCETA
jgi:hypothetical protein